MSFAAAEADRRIANVIAIGTVTEVSGSDSTARVALGDLTTNPLQVGSLRAGGMQVWWMPTVGEQVVVAAPAGDLARGVILCSIHAGNAPSSSADTPTIDLRGGTMVFNGDLKITGDIDLTGDITMTGDLDQDGSIEITGDVTSDADVVASGISLTTHVHSGVLAGPATTGGPQ